ncbi:MAG TPA: NAD(P)/FAD-dependent oxidoreductase [Acidimicrobiia bacterium]|nr:NAD(P)/FAD-dependent oxidoreductase [Acidimicrobiia bacterium]
MTSETCEVIVLGMGTSGEDAALRLAKAGVDVIGIEGNLIGGECPYWACLPSKSMIRSANLVTEARRADGLIGSVSVETDWSTVAARIRSEITGGWNDDGGVERFEAKGGRFRRGWAKVTGPHQVELDGTQVGASRGILVATGSKPMIPPIPGLAEVRYWTNREAIEVEELPDTLVILGGGPVGCELGQVFARFGVAVTIVEGEDRLLRSEEPEASQLLAAALIEDGVDLRLGVRAESATEDGNSISLRLDDGTSVEAERLLVATGRRADADSLGVTAAGARTERGFVAVDDYMRAAEGLWAIGDVTGKGLLTQVAEYQGMIAVEDILGGEPERADYSALPRAVFTDPEVGGVGMTEAEARAAGHDVTVTVKDVGATFRGWLHRTGNSGLIKLVVDRAEGRLLGASIVGPRATDVLGFVALAVQERIPLQNLVNMIYAFPTFYGGVGETLGSYGRGIVRVMDPDTPPVVDDPPYERN